MNEIKTDIRKFQKNIIKWYKEYGRKNLPWQRNTTSYRVWISEIMLQQTQVETVIPYFEKFTAQFPDIKALVETSLDQVLHLWSGLGYYSRARNIYKTAQIIQKEFSGIFPKDLELLQTLPGIGKSTAGAMMVFGMNQRAAILDGNVKRVLARCFIVEGSPSEAGVLKKLWELSESHTPREQVREYTQAMMDIGALICTRTKPSCEKCPLEKTCLAHQTKTERLYPQKKPKKTVPIRCAKILMIRNNQKEWFLEKRPNIGLWGGLWSFPQCEMDDDPLSFCQRRLGILAKVIKTLPIYKHAFSHFQLHLTPIVLDIDKKPYQIMEDQNIIWYNETQKVGLPKPITVLIKQLKKASL